jgi:hypothetical protein
MVLDKIRLLEAIALLMASDQGVIDLTTEDKALISTALGGHELKA